MAMRPQTGGVRAVYEDFRPFSEWKQDDESYILNVYLPGFTKEQVRLSTEGKNTIGIRGERLVGGNKWSRFLEDFQVPESGDISSVRAVFRGGILNITVPMNRETPSPKPEQSDVQNDRGDVLPEVDTSKPADEGSIRRQKKLQKVLDGDEVVGTKELPGGETQWKKADKRLLHGDVTEKKCKKFKAVEGLAGLNEERRLLVNMGTAMLVVVAVAAYVFC